MSSLPIIHIDKISKKYKDADAFALQDLSLQIPEGEIYGLLGPNGAGKTTLISILCGLLRPTSGRFTIDGLHYSDRGMAIKKIIGVVPQEYALYPTLTAKENLVYFGSMYGLKGHELDQRVDILLTKMGLEKFANKCVDTFSGGMKRRVNLLAGVMHQPKVLFLDEPTVGVDVQSKNAILQFLKEINARGTSIIYTSHHLVEAQDFCTCLSIIDQGQILRTGTPQALVAALPNARNLEDVFIQLTGKELRDAI